MTESALALDLVCARAWPPVEEIAADGWKLRFSAGMTKRANSALPCPPPDEKSGKPINDARSAYRRSGGAR